MKTAAQIRERPEADAKPSIMSIGKTNAIFTQISKYQTAVHTHHSGEMARKLVNFARSELSSDPIPRCFSPIPEPGTISAIPLPKWEQQICAMIEFVSSVESPGRQAWRGPAIRQKCRHR